jgi:murein DD-endopeptidase MepM/ murein hydrolase activator NlpD
MENRKIVGVLLVMASLGIAILFATKGSWLRKTSHPPHADDQPLELVSSEVRSAPAVEIQEVRIEAGSSFYETLLDAGLAKPDVLSLIKQVGKAAQLSQLPANTQLNLEWQEEVLKGLIVDLSPIEQMVIAREAATSPWTVFFKKIPVVTTKKLYSGTVESTLWESARQIEADPRVIDGLMSIFEWQIDFSRELKSGAYWTLLIEEHTAQDKLIGFGNILGARLVNGDQEWVGVRYGTGQTAEYFDLSGKNLKARFLKSPVRYNHISSRFQLQRFHPVLGVNRPHTGVDYAAPSGTPIYAVGDGEVNYAGWNGNSGIMVQIKHDSTYETAYKHLSRTASKMRPGYKIKQGQVLGYVGQTGLATGPHLHFEFFEHGKFVDPLGVRFPRARALEARDRKNFDRVVKSLYPSLMGAPEEAMVTDTTSSTTIKGRKHLTPAGI